MEHPSFSNLRNVKAIPITGLTKEAYSRWLEQQTPSLKKQLSISKFEAKSGSYFLCFGTEGELAEVVLGMEDSSDFWAFGSLSKKLPEGYYQIAKGLSEHIYPLIYLAWGLGSYQFTRYKLCPTVDAKLILDESIEPTQFVPFIETIFWIRDLINTPTQDLGPKELALEADKLAKQFNAQIQLILKDTLKTEYPCIYAVGKGSDRDPCLIDLRWGNPDHPKITLVGKGVCFDSGGYDIKPADGMLTMKKDMAGAAHALGLAKLIMMIKLPVRLRVLVPVVENLVSGRSYLPGDIIRSRKGDTIEITNTDAEGRVILSDALFEASQEKPELLIDFSSLTGAATIALGGEIGVFFTNRASLASALMEQSEKLKDPLWQLPLYAPYRNFFKSPIADMSNAALSARGAGGAITAALFLESFVDPEVPWIHFDLLAANRQEKPGRPEGGEAMSLRAVFAYLQEKYG